MICQAGTEKSQLRKRIEQAIRNMPAHDRFERSAAIQKRLCDLSDFHSARTIMFYFADETEVGTMQAIKTALLAGKTVGLPRIDTAQRSMSIHRIADLEQDLQSNRFALHEPRGHLPEISLSQLELIVVPGRVFDTQCNRMGRGGGFYDRFMAKPELQARRIALAFECQLVEQVPMKPHDLKVDAIVTEKRFIAV